MFRQNRQLADVLVRAPYLIDNARTLVLLPLSRTDILNAASFNVDQIIRYGDAVLIFGEDVNQEDIILILT